MNYAEVSSIKTTRYFTIFEARIFCLDPETRRHMISAARFTFSVYKQKGLATDSMTLAILNKMVSLQEVLWCLRSCWKIRFKLRSEISAAWRSAMLVDADEELGIDYYHFVSTLKARDILEQEREALLLSQPILIQ